jgi:hypothetical protein
VVAVDVTGLGAERTLGRQWGVKKGEAEFPADKKAVFVSRDSVVVETPG